jgi:hypothetical protein
MTPPPQLGQAGGISYEDEGQAMVAEGWRLKAIDVPVYVFERCNPPAP